MNLRSQSGRRRLLRRDGTPRGRQPAQPGAPRADGSDPSVRAVHEAAKALAAAHAAGVVHRDVKPANLMLSRSGRCKVVDFGLAHLDKAGRSGQWTGAGSMENVGTPQFMAPRSSAERPPAQASDIYSLGGTLFYLLTGHALQGQGRPRDAADAYGGAGARSAKVSGRKPIAGWPMRWPLRLAKRPTRRWATMEQFARVLRVHSIPTASTMIRGDHAPAHARLLPVRPVRSGLATLRRQEPPGQAAGPAAPGRTRPFGESPSLLSGLTYKALGLPAWAWLAGGTRLRRALPSSASSSRGVRQGISPLTRPDGRHRSRLKPPRHKACQLKLHQYKAPPPTRRSRRRLCPSPAAAAHGDPPSPARRVPAIG